MTTLNTFLATPYASSANRIDFMDHSNSSGGWDWIYTNDFKFYLIENCYINNYTIGKPPHNGRHTNCGYCQLETIKKDIRKRRKNIQYHTLYNYLKSNTFVNSLNKIN